MLHSTAMKYTFKTLDEIDVIDDSLVQAYNTLSQQLSSTSKDVSKAQLQEVKNCSESELLLLAYDDTGVLVGTVQGSFLCIPSKQQLYINSLVVDQSQRGQGLGSMLMEEVEARAKKRWSSIARVLLTSSPSRGTRSFFEKLGFIARVPENENETIAYQKEIE